jgi:hypothetical protein
MNVTEQVQRALSSFVPSDHWVMAKDGRGTRAIGNLCQMRNGSPRQSLGRFAVMISNDKVLLRARQPGKLNRALFAGGSNS